MQTNPLTRPDTMFGVCQAIGEDFGFNPIYLRLIFGGLLLWNPVAVIAAYAVLGAVVGLSRLAGRTRRPVAAVEPETVPVRAEEPVELAVAA
ncbi:MAG: PspC domain-containing protein [Alphaproteobacteria bacterium]|nr:MAG: PspC domain-containing protein [Alphaproteobacteria bacterium]